MTKKRIAVFGIGYVGCVTGACLARDGNHVVGVDIDQGKIDALQKGFPPVAEPGLDQLVEEQVKNGRLTATTDAEAAIGDTEMALITVGTPSTDSGAVNSNAVKRVLETIGQCLRSGEKNYTVVIRSTLLPGILEEELKPVLEESLGEEIGHRVDLCNNPEFLRETTAIKDYDNPPFVVVGAEDEYRAKPILDLYNHLTAETIVTDTRTAALIKYGCNSFHALKVAFANEIGMLAKSFGADGQEAMRILCIDYQLNISPAYLRPGFAFGGSCLPKDVRALTRYAQQQAIPSDLLQSILSSNETVLDAAFRLVEKAGQRVIGLIGLSFKSGTDDLRESPQVILAEKLLGKGYDLKIYDPDVSVSRLKGANLAYVDRHLPHLSALLVEEPQEVFDHAELLILGTNIANDVDWENRFEGETIDLRKDLVVSQDEQKLANRQTK